MHELAKPEFDIGFFTNKLPETLAFWREEFSLAYEDPVHFNDGLVQHRHALGNTVIKINGAEDGVEENAPGGYGALYIASDEVSEKTTKTDPNGNVIHLVPPGTYGITNVGFVVPTQMLDEEEAFFLNAMGFSRQPTGWLRAGNCQILLKEEPKRQYCGHWVNAGFRYFTFHVKRVDEAFAAIIAAGGTEGEKPYAIGDIAKISFVRSPSGNWIEVAQRRELAGAW